MISMTLNPVSSIFKLSQSFLVKLVRKAGQVDRHSASH